MNPIIFLDIDEVVCIKHTRGTSYRDIDEYGEKFDPYCVSQLQRIVDATGADIVLSSKWRKDGFFKNLSMWKDRKMPGKLIGTTPFKGIGGGGNHGAIQNQPEEKKYRHGWILPGYQNTTLLLMMIQIFLYLKNLILFKRSMELD